MATKAPKLTEAEQVAAYMNQLEHPLKAEIEAVREIIKTASPKLSERIKWNAPSYYYNADLVTFNPRMQHKVHLVFHHPSIVKIDSPLLEGDYKDRRMLYFNSIAEVEAHKAELQRILNASIDWVERDRQ